MKIAVERATRKDAVHIAGAVNFELVDAVLTNEVDRHFTKSGVVLRAGKSKSARIGFIALLAPVFQACFFRFVITTPRREPYPRRRIKTRGLSGQGGKSIGKPGIEAPESARIIPAIVEEKRVDLYMPFFRQFLPKGADHIKRLGLTVGVFIADVEPRVVVKK